MSIPMTAKRSFVYAGKRVAKGQEFNARGVSDARVLSAVGHAVESQASAIPAAAAPLRGQYQTRVMTAAAPAAYVAPAPSAPPVAPMVIKVEGADVVLDDMDGDALHALATQLNVHVHPLTGAKKLRQALVDSQKSAE